MTAQRSVTSERPAAIAVIRKDIDGAGTDVDHVAERYGYRIVWTVYLDTSPLMSALIVSATITSYRAVAVVVPSLEHAADIRHTITDIAALATPVRIYPRGHCWLDVVG